MQCVCISAAGGGDGAAADDARGIFGECAAPRDTHLRDVAGGDGFSIGVDESGAVVGWGSAFYGELLTEQQQSDDTRRDAAAATASMPHAYVRTLLSPTRLAVPEKCAYVACGSNHVLAISQHGSVFAWGWNRHHQVSPSTDDMVSQPLRVEFPEAADAMTAVAGGGMHSLALDARGHVWSWGDNTHGQLGTARSDPASNVRPSRVALECKAHSISAGWAHSALLSDTNELLSYGWGLYHQLGHGETRDEHLPRSVSVLRGLDASCGGPVVQVVCGTWHTAVRLAAGDVYTWGWGHDGQLGHGADVKTQVLPRIVTAAANGYFDAADAGHRAVDIACGARETLVLCANGELHWWGRHARAAPSRNAWGTLKNSQICARVTAGRAHALLLVESSQSSTRGMSAAGLTER